MAGTAMRGALTRLAAPPKAAADALEKLNITTTDTNGNMLDLFDILAQIESAFEGLGEAEQLAAAKAIFGQEAMSGWLAVIGNGGDSLAKFNEELMNSAGVAQEMADIKADTLAGQIDSFKSAVEGLLLVVYNELLPLLTPLIEKLTDAVRWFTQLEPAIQRNIIKFAAIAAVVGPVLIILGKTATAISTLITFFMKIVPAIKATIAFFTKFGLIVAKAGVILGKIAATAKIVGLAIAGFVIGPMLAVVAAVTAVIGIGYLLVKNWETVKDLLGNIFAGISEFFAGMVDFIKQGLDNVLEFFSNMASRITEIMSNIASNIKEKIDSIIEFFSNMLENIKNVIAGIIESLKQFVQSAADAVRSVIDSFLNMVSNIREAVANGISAIKDFASGVWDGMKDAANAVKESVMEMIGWIMELPKKAWEAATGMASAIAEGASNMVNSIPGVGLIKKGANVISSGASAIGSKMPFWNKDGGFYNSPTVIGLGEAGPEVALPLRDDVLAGVGKGVADNMPEEKIQSRRTYEMGFQPPLHEEETNILNSIGNAIEKATEKAENTLIAILEQINIGVNNIANQLSPNFSPEPIFAGMPVAQQRTGGNIVIQKAEFQVQQLQTEQDIAQMRELIQTVASEDLFDMAIRRL